MDYGDRNRLLDDDETSQTRQGGLVCFRTPRSTSSIYRQQVMRLLGAIRRPSNGINALLDGDE